ncbi:MAG: hypothetical protein J2P54_18810, partial [Bradyrhizobiaceae bacterium]|nr:hypothetical protein [Bradyrhizobiaceae bacterium]
AGFIAPAPDGRRGDLAQRQADVVGRVQAAVAAQSTALANAADRSLAQPTVEPTRFQPISTAEAVLRYGGDFLPSWAGAISIDMLPAVLVLVLCIAHAGIRKEGESEEKEVANAKAYTVSDLIAVVRLVREVEQAQQARYHRRLVREQASGQQDDPRAQPAERDPDVGSPKAVPLAPTEEPKLDPELEQNVMQLLTARAGKKE